MAAQQPAGASTGGQDDAAGRGVIAAFVLGWHLAELFHSNVPGSVRRRQASLEKLPGVGELDPLARARLLLAQVQVDLRRVWQLIDLEQQQPPDPSPVRSLLEAESRAPGQLRAATAALHGELLVALTAADFRLGKAYGLGRALAETALLPDAKNPQTLQQLFARYRLATLLEWLADLKSVFPPHAAEAVRGSLPAWGAWSLDPILLPPLDARWQPGDGEVEDPAPVTVPAPPTGRTLSRWMPAGRPRLPQGRRVDWSLAADRESVTRALHRQGQLWRAVLSGEKDCVDLLSGDDYVRAGDRLLGQLRRLLLGFLRRFWITTSVLAVLVVVITATLVFVDTASRVAVVVLTAAGGIGLTWKSAASGLGRVLGHVQRPLWDSELDIAVATAITRLPRERRTAERR